MKSDYDSIIKDAVKKHLPAGYDWRLFKAQLWQESRLDPFAESPAGARGIGQFMKPTWNKWSIKAGYEKYSRTSSEASIYTAALYMGWLIGQWSVPRPKIDRYCLAMASYNSGLGNILDAQVKAGDPPLYADIIDSLPHITGRNAIETIDYVRKILHFCSAQITGEL